MGGKFVADLGATFHAGLAVIGESLGLYKALTQADAPLTPAELAQRTSTSERYVREWLGSQVAGGYVEYDATTQRYFLSAEQAFALANEQSPTYLPGAFLLAVSTLRAVPQITERFRTGEGFGWHEHDHGLFRGTELFFRPSYAANLVHTWIPALDAVGAKLQAGAKVADAGCGLGASTILMAQAYPNATFLGKHGCGKSLRLPAQDADQRSENISAIGVGISGLCGSEPAARGSHRSPTSDTCRQRLARERACDMADTKKPLAEKIAIVTGGSRGIGAAVCQRLSAAGAHITLTYAQSADAANSVAEACRRHAVKAVAVHVDAGDVAAGQHLVHQMVWLGRGNCGDGGVFGRAAYGQYDGCDAEQ